MSWLTENPIATMYGPHFLVFYGIVIVLTLVACWFMLRRQAERSFPPGESSRTDAFEEADSAGWPIRLAGASVIVGLGGYKLLIALANGRHNVGFLVIFCVVALAVLLIMCPLPPGREGD